MSIFVITLNDNASPELRERIEQFYPEPNSFEFSGNIFFVQDKNIPQTIAERLGIRVEEDNLRTNNGAVFKLDGSYSGFTSRALWDWLSLMEDDQK